MATLQFNNIGISAISACVPSKIERNADLGYFMSEEEINKALQDTVKQGASLVLKEGLAAEGDTVVIDFEGRVNGEVFEGGTATNYELELGSHTFIPGFEEQLVGKSAGEEVDVNVTFPHEYHEALKDKDAVFHCVVHEVKTKSVPELNDEFVKELNIEGVTTVEELKVRKTEEIKAEKTRKARSEYFGKLLDVIASNSKVAIPNEIIENQVQSSKKEIIGRMAQSGLTLEQYLQIVGQTEEDFMNKLHEDASRDARNYFILDAVATKEEMHVSDEEVEFEYAKIADQYKMNIEDVKKALAPQVDEFKNNLKMQRVEDFLYENNN